MHSLAHDTDVRVMNVRIDETRLEVDLMDGRTIAVPLAWYPRLANATAEQRSHWELAGGGYGIHWPMIDEDLSTEGLLRGARAPQELWRSLPDPKGYVLETNAFRERSGSDPNFPLHITKDRKETIFSLI